MTKIPAAGEGYLYDPMGNTVRVKLGTQGLGCLLKPALSSTAWS